MKTRIAVIVLLASCFAGRSVQAHHSYAAFATDQIVTLEGDIQHILFVNPHSRITLTTKDDTVYNIEWAGWTQLRNAGVSNSSLRIGDHIIVRGSPRRDLESHVVSLIKEVRRPIDGWTWGQPGK